MTKTNEQNAPQWTRMEDLLDQGYEVMGVLDKDSTQEDIRAVAEKMAEKMTPPKGHPIWKKVADELIKRASDYYYVIAMAECDELARFEEGLLAYLAAGGDEDEYWKNIRQENSERWESRDV